MRKSCFILSAFLLMSCSVQVLGQTHEETSSQVPELKAFHEVIFKLWHEAWPEKNLAMMKELIPGIDSHLVKIQKVQLPGILRDKKAKWDEGVKALGEVVDAYKKANASADTQKILDAGENLHSAYEKMVRIIRPVLKEIEAFHQVLYPLYHYYMPEYNKEKIKASSARLQAAMDTLNLASLPERLKAKEKGFLRARGDLERAVKFVVKVANEIDDEKTVTDAIKEMHTKYQLLEKIFD